CPLSCGARYEPKGDSCVLKTCPRGMTLNGNGACAALPPPPQQKQATPVKPPAPAGGGKKVASGGAGGGCVKETAAQCQGRMESDPRARGASALGRGGMDSFMIEAYCSSPANRVCH